MKHTILILIVLCSFINAQAQKITRSYDNVSMSEALRDLNEQDLASFLCVTPNYLSTIRKDITFETKTSALSLSSLRLSPSAPDFRALPRFLLCRFNNFAHRKGAISGCTN